MECVDFCKSPQALSGTMDTDDESPDICASLDTTTCTLSCQEDVDRIEKKRVKNCHRERCRVQKLNSSLYRLNMMLPQGQRSPGNGKHFSKAIILETCIDFIYQLENHVFDLLFNPSECKAPQSQAMLHTKAYFSSLLTTRRARRSTEESRHALRVKRPKNSFILFSMGQRKQLLRENPRLDNNKVSKILGEKWKKLDDESKSKFNELAKIEKSNHKRKFPDFNYTIKRKRPRPITKKAVETAVSDYLKRDGSFIRLNALIHKFPPTFSLRDIIIASCSDRSSDTLATMDAVKLADTDETRPTDLYRPYCGADILSSHQICGWGYPFEDPLYPQQAFATAKSHESPDNVATFDFARTYLEYHGLEEALVAPKEELEYGEEMSQIFGCPLNSTDYMSPSLFYYPLPLSPSQLFSHVEPLSSGFSHLPLFSLPPISQLISHEN